MRLKPWREAAVHNPKRSRPGALDPGCSVEEKTRVCRCGWQFIRLNDGHWVGPFACGTDRVMTGAEFRDAYPDCYYSVAEEKA